MGLVIPQNVSREGGPRWGHCKASGVSGWQSHLYSQEGLQPSHQLLVWYTISPVGALMPDPKPIQPGQNAGLGHEGDDQVKDGH